MPGSRGPIGCWILRGRSPPASACGIVASAPDRHFHAEEAHKALSRLVASQPFGVRPSDAVTLAVVLALMTAAAGAAAYAPGRAARIHPAIALRTE